MFTRLQEIDWRRAAIVAGTITAFWSGLITIVPERFHHIGMVILAAAQTAITFAMRAEKGVKPEPDQSPSRQIQVPIQAIDASAIGNTVRDQVLPEIIKVLDDGRALFSNEHEEEKK